jgi:cadmium resistance protein CadD (predicted permease)
MILSIISVLVGLYLGVAAIIFISLMVATYRSVNDKVDAWDFLTAFIVGILWLPILGLFVWAEREAEKEDDEFTGI